MRAHLVTLATAVLTTACSIVPDPVITALVAEVDEARLTQHVQTLCAFSPRPAGDAAATAATLAHLEQHLAASGYTPVREPFQAIAMSWRRQQEADGTTSFRVTAASELRHNLIAEKRGASDAAPVVEPAGFGGVVTPSCWAGSSAARAVAATRRGRGMGRAA